MCLLPKLNLLDSGSVLEVLFLPQILPATYTMYLHM